MIAAEVRLSPTGSPRGLDRAAVIVGLAVAAIAFIAVFVNYRAAGGVSDWDQIWLAGRALLHGQDPYLAVNADNSPWGLRYPLPAVLVSLPFALLPINVARALWFACGAGILAYAWGTPPRWRLVGLVSGGMIWAAIGVQWTPLLVASLWLPWCAIAYVCKPTTAAPLWMARPSILPVAAGAALLGLSFVLVPGWVGSWLTATADAYHTPLLVRPGGFLLLLPLLRWRRAEARLLLLLAFVPSSGMPYDLLLLYAVADSKRDWIVLTGLAQGVAIWGEAIWHPGVADYAFAHILWPAELLLGYVPAVWMVLLRSNRRG